MNVFDERTMTMLDWLAGLGAAALTELADVAGLSRGRTSPVPSAPRAGSRPPGPGLSRVRQGP
jgi:hypothetical protein